MNSRSSWLDNTRKYLKQDIRGKKYFRIHKNEHRLDIFPASLSPINNKSIIDRESSPKNPSQSSIRGSNPSFSVQQVLQEKESELNSLKFLYEQANSKIKSMEKIRSIQKNLEDLSQISPKRSALPSIHNLTPQNINTSQVARNKSVLNYKVETSFDFPLKSQPKFTKNRPKVVFSNPITGVPNYF